MSPLQKLNNLIFVTLLTSLHTNQFGMTQSVCPGMKVTFKPGYSFQPICNQSSLTTATNASCAMLAAKSNVTSALVVTSLSTGSTCQVTPFLCPRYKLTSDDTTVFTPVGITVLEHVVFSIKSGCGTKVWDLFTGASPANSDYVVQPAHPDAATLPSKFRSSLLDNVQRLISRLIYKHFIVQLYKNTTVVQRLVFDVGVSSASVTHMNWFNMSRLVQSSPVTNLKSIDTNYFSITGHAELNRRFFISLVYYGCPNDKALMLVLDDGNDDCNFYKFSHSVPRIVYSRDVTQGMSATNMDADYMAILVV